MTAQDSDDKRGKDDEGNRKRYCEEIERGEPDLRHLR
jgi:hypothetical protein